MFPLTGAVFKGHIYSDKLVHLLVFAYVTTREVPLTVEMLNLVTSNCAVQVNDWVGQFILSVLMFRKVRTEPEQLCELLKVHLLIMLLIIHVVRCIHKIAKSVHELCHVPPSILPQGTTQLPLNRFSRNLIFGHFINWLRIFKFYLNMTRMTGPLHVDVCTFVIIYHCILLRMRNVSGRSCREN
jgi:hypothetical protein